MGWAKAEQAGCFQDASIFESTLQIEQRPGKSCQMRTLGPPPSRREFQPNSIPVTIKLAFPFIGTHCSSLTERGFRVADTKKIEDKLERKKVKRTARKKAAPKAKRTGARGSNKKKLKKLTRGQSKR
jgi:hypothetical protein